MASAFVQALLRGAPGVLAKGLAGRNQREQIEYGRAQDERELSSRESDRAAQRALQEQILNWNREQSIAQAAERKRLAEADAIRQAQNDVVDAQRAGYEDATAESVSSGMNAATRALGMGSGGQMQPTRTDPFKTTAGGVEVKAPEMGGPQYAMVGGRWMKLDRQRGANAKAQADAQDYAAQDARDQRTLSRQEAADARRAAREEASFNRRLTMQEQRIPKPASDSERQAATFYTRMRDADSIVGTTGAPTTMDDMKEGALPDFAAKYVRNDNQRSRLTAQKNFITAVLRKESGASISPAEFEDAARIYFPQTGDSPALIAQKETNRKLAMQGMYRQAGRAAQEYGLDAPGGAPQRPGDIK